jgi:hypothetical protein
MAAGGRTNYRAQGEINIVPENWLQITIKYALETTGWTIGWSRLDPRQGQRIFLLAPASRPALRPTQPPIQWVPGVLSPGVKRGRGVTLTTHPHLVAEVKYE